VAREQVLLSADPSSSPMGGEYLGYLVESSSIKKKPSSTSVWGGLKN
jgi:hypothetical protein